MTTKTPVSILHEYMSKQGITPMYELIQDSAGHDPIFKYIVCAGKVTGEGVGRAKKEARHKAAQKALEMLAHSDSFIRTQLLLIRGDPSDRIGDVEMENDVAPVAVSPYAEQVTENSVGALADLCAECKLGEPVYNVVSESGPPHAKTFNFRCTVQRLQEFGSSRTKKQAKQISAKRMIDKIKENLELPSLGMISKPQVNIEQVHVNESNSKAIEGYCLIKDKEQPGGMPKNISQTFGTSHLALKELYSSQLSTLRAYASHHSAEDTVQHFADGNDVDLIYSCIKAMAVGMFLCTARLSTTPELLQVGEGPDESMAKDMASINLLRTLMYMIADYKDEQ